MIAIGLLFVRMLCDCFKSRRRLEAEILVLRHQLNVLQQRMPRRVHLRWADRAVFIWLYRRYPRILDAITIFRPDTVVRLSIIVGYAPGGVTDTIARLISQWLSERLGRQFVVENRPGASGNIAAEVVARAAADGYTLLLVASNNAYNATLYDKLHFNFVRDIAPVASICRDSFVMVVNPSFPPKTVPEFITYAKAKGGKMNMGSSGPGSGSQLYGELFKVMTGVDLVAVNYRGVGVALPDLMSGRLEVMFIPVATAIGYLRSGTLWPLGVTAATRVGVLPDVPTVGEFVPGYEATGWTGVGAPANTPQEITAILNREVNAALSDPTFKARLVDLGVEPFVTSPVEFGQFIVASSVGGTVRPSALAVLRLMTNSSLVGCSTGRSSLAVATERRPRVCARACREYNLSF